MTTLEAMQSILKKNLDLSADLVKPETTLEALAIDSLALIEVMFEVEEEFKITVPTAPAATHEQLKTIGNLVAYIDTLVADQHSLQSEGQVAA
ncbi:MAG: acyl carrier protein [Betaproteobacteria bacterium]